MHDPSSQLPPLPALRGIRAHGDIRVGGAVMGHRSSRQSRKGIGMTAAEKMQVFDLDYYCDQCTKYFSQPTINGLCPSCAATWEPGGEFGGSLKAGREVGESAEVSK